MICIEIAQDIVVIACILAACWLTRVAIKSWKGDSFLCDNCAFNDETRCQKPERPKALECAAYRKSDSNSA